MRSTSGWIGRRALQKGRERKGILKGRESNNINESTGNGTVLEGESMAGINHQNAESEGLLLFFISPFRFV